MLNAFNLFKTNIASARTLSGLFDFLTATLTVPHQFDDLLRSQLVYAISALDKLNHDLIRIGMVGTFTGTRSPTAKYQGFTISTETHSQIMSATVPPKEYWFESEIVQKHKVLAFQDPAKIADGLSLIWDEKHKWAVIAAEIGMSETDVKLKLKTIVDRRNLIVHEADLNPYTGTKYDIDKNEAKSATDLIESIGSAIFNLVK